MKPWVARLVPSPPKVPRWREVKDGMPTWAWALLAVLALLPLSVLALAPLLWATKWGMYWFEVALDPWWRWWGNGPVFPAR